MITKLAIKTEMLYSVSFHLSATKNSSLFRATLSINPFPKSINSIRFVGLMEIRIINKSNNALPAYETAGSAGMDVRAFVEAEVVLKPLERKLIPTGLFIELPVGYEAQLRPRSGLAFKHGISLPNSPATIDSDYRGEIKVALINLSNEDFSIKNGDRIAQMIIAQHERAEWIAVKELNDTERGHGGFGSTGK
jgi:dUTP pyrophosphatase